MQPKLFLRLSSQHESPSKSCKYQNSPAGLNRSTNIVVFAVAASGSAILVPPEKNVHRSDSYLELLMDASRAQDGSTSAVEASANETDNEDGPNRAVHDTGRSSTTPSYHRLLVTAFENTASTKANDFCAEVTPTQSPEIQAVVLEPVELLSEEYNIQLAPKLAKRVQVEVEDSSDTDKIDPAGIPETENNGRNDEPEHDISSVFNRAAFRSSLNSREADTIENHSPLQSSAIEQQQSTSLVAGETVEHGKQYSFEEDEVAVREMTSIGNKVMEKVSLFVNRG